MPVPPVGDGPGLVGGPDDEVRRARPDLVVAAGAAVELRGLRPRHGPHEPLTVVPGFGTRPPGGRTKLPLGRPTARPGPGTVTSRHPQTLTARRTPHPNGPAHPRHKPRPPARQAALQAHEPTPRVRRPTLQAHEPTVQARKPNLQARKPNLQTHEPTLQARKPTAQARMSSIQVRESSTGARELTPQSRESTSRSHVMPLQSQVMRPSRHVWCPSVTCDARRRLRRPAPSAGGRPPSGAGSRRGRGRPRPTVA
ncbi:MAG: Herpes virus major outer envelope glycoprotein, partial [Actinomycetota bacterium]|nr:Herpes virus major outer envelope glycoprotein [Actinomycetota bacterium]